MSNKNEENIIEAAALQALDPEVWTVHKLAAEYGVSTEEIQRWMAKPRWDEILQTKRLQTILETRFFQFGKILNHKMIATTNITDIVASASIELIEKVKNGEISALEALERTRSLCNAQESGDKTLETILELEDAMFGLSEILGHINTDENKNQKE